MKTDRWNNYRKANDKFPKVRERTSINAQES